MTDSLKTAIKTTIGLCQQDLVLLTLVNTSHSFLLSSIQLLEDINGEYYGDDLAKLIEAQKIVGAVYLRLETMTGNEQFYVDIAEKIHNGLEMEREK